MKTQEEQNVLKEEIETMKEQKDMLTLEESKLAKVNGGAMPDRDNVFQKIQGIIEKTLGVSADSIYESSSIPDDLGADSLDVVDVVSSIEESFQIKFSPAVYENIKTVQDLCNLVILSR